MKRKVLATIAGFVLAVVVVFLLETLGHQIYPPPDNLDFNDVEALKEYVMSLPVGAMLFLLVAWSVGNLAGGVFAGFFGREQKLAYIIGVLIMVASIMNLVFIPHPIWFSGATISSIVAMTFVAKFLSKYLLEKD